MTLARKAAGRVAIPIVAYALLDWAFAYVTVAEGLVTPRSVPDVGVVALGAAYLVARVVVRWLVPAFAAFTLVEAALRARCGFLRTKVP